MIAKTILLASKSPRRNEILMQSKLSYRQVSIDASEDYPATMPQAEVAEYIAQSKAAAFTEPLGPDKILLTADTIVLHKGMILGKPSDRDEAIQFLSGMSNDTHQVITGVVLRSNEKTISFSVVSEVVVDTLSSEEIEFYVDTYKPMDKAGAYGIQEWFGICKVKEIKGSYLNIVGLHMQAVYSALAAFK